MSWYSNFEYVSRRHPTFSLVITFFSITWKHLISSIVPRACIGWLCRTGTGARSGEKNWILNVNSPVFTQAPFIEKTGFPKSPVFTENDTDATKLSENLCDTFLFVHQRCVLQLPLTLSANSLCLLNQLCGRVYTPYCPAHLSDWVSIKRCAFIDWSFLQHGYNCA